MTTSFPSPPTGGYAPPPIGVPEPRVVSATVTIRMSDGEEVTCDLHEGARKFDVAIEHDEQFDDDFDPFGIPVPTFGNGTRYRVRIDADYGLAVGPHGTLTRRPAG